MTESGFQLLKSRILQMLREGLNPRLTYHSRGHTLDVLKQAERIAMSEHISDSRSLMLIRIAALFHDTGFIDTYGFHEERSCEIMLENIDSREFSQNEITTMSGLIMATKVPQVPANLCEMIICDADLDYLGRDDFQVISNKLKQEFLAFGVVKDEMEWYQRQVDFMDKHGYFTTTSLTNRHPVKIQYLDMLKQDLLNQKS